MSKSLVTNIGKCPMRFIIIRHVKITAYYSISNNLQNNHMFFLVLLSIFAMYLSIAMYLDNLTLLQ